MSDLLPTYRIESAPRALHYSFEKAGLVLHDQPIPWSAESVVVEANLHLPTPDLRHPRDYQLLVPDREAVRADAVQRQANTTQREQRYAVTFRLPPPTQTQTVTLLWRNRELGRLELPVLGRQAFLDGLQLHLPTLYVRLGEESVACKTFVSSQCKGLLATALLTSPTGLAPLADFELFVDFRIERESTPQSVAVRLSSTQLAARQALLTVTPPRLHRGTGLTTALWRLGDRELARQEVRGITLRAFQRSLRVLGTRYVQQRADGSVTLTRTLPTGERRGRIGPCFLLCSRESGMAGVCSFQVVAQVVGAVQPPLLLEQDVLVSDGPVIVAPGTLDAAESDQVMAFALMHQGRALAQLAMRPPPSATFTSEGGFRPPPEFAWSSAAEDELDQRLNRLLEERFRQS